MKLLYQRKSYLNLLILFSEMVKIIVSIQFKYTNRDTLQSNKSKKLQIKLVFFLILLINKIK